MLTEFDRDAFAEAIDTVFTLTAQSGQVDLKLAEVSELRETPRHRAFSLVFVVPAGYFVDQGLYDLQNERLGAMQLFLVPIGTRENCQELESVFNFLKTG